MLRVLVLRPSAGSVCPSSRVLQGALEHHSHPPPLMPNKSPFVCHNAGHHWLCLWLVCFGPKESCRIGSAPQRHVFHIRLHIQSPETQQRSPLVVREHSTMAGHPTSHHTRHLNSSVDIALIIMCNVQSWFCHALKEPSTPHVKTERRGKTTRERKTHRGNRQKKAVRPVSVG